MLTDKQKEVYDILKKSREEMGFQPSIPEIAEMKGVTSAAIYYRVDALKKKGYVEKEGNRKYKILK